MRERRRDDAATTSRPRIRRVTVLLILTGLLVAKPVWSALTRSWLSRATVPLDLIGVWVTTAPGYQDRALEFTGSSVLLHSDEYHFTVHAIRRVTQQSHGLYTTFRIEYQEGDGVTPLVFRYIPSPHPLIRLEHLPSVWRRQLQP